MNVNQGFPSLVGQGSAPSLAKEALERARRGREPLPLPRGRKEEGSRPELRRIGRGHGFVPLGRRSSAAAAADIILKLIFIESFGSRGERIQTVELTQNRIRATDSGVV